ncbi:MAG TPA: serine O-acetyltransferase, partial [Rhodospirillaceae bacterium]|nr:serine O-acetyltransferase [Rhodospirillaceae bacterium]
TLGDRVVVGTGAAVLGDIHIGDDCRIGANAVVVKSVPANSVVVGIPGQAILRSKRHDASDPPDFQHALMPDMIGTSLVALLARVEHLEAQSVKPPPHLPTPDQNGIWHGEDFSI